MTMTLKEIYQALINDETLISKSGNKVRIKNNKLVEEDGSQNYTSFASPESWSIYKDPNDPKNWIGKLCWFWDICEDDKLIGFLSDYCPKNESPFWRDKGFTWENCRPLTREEVEQYLVKEN